jgi:hypothetical protein
LVLTGFIEEPKVMCPQLSAFAMRLLDWSELRGKLTNGESSELLPFVFLRSFRGFYSTMKIPTASIPKPISYPVNEMIPREIVRRVPD